MHSENGDFLKDVLLRLKTSRVCRGYRFKDNFSDSFGISRSTYSAHESGKRMEKISLTSLKKYADCLKINILWLLFGYGEPCDDKSVADAIGNTIKRYEKSGEIGVVYPPIVDSGCGSCQVDITVLKMVLVRMLDVFRKKSDLQAEEFVDFVFHLYNQVVTLSCSDDEKDRILGICVSSCFNDIKAPQNDQRKSNISTL